MPTVTALKVPDAGSKTAALSVEFKVASTPLTSTAPAPRGADM